MNIIFTGPPLTGKGTQAHLLGKHLGIPVFSIGALLRKACEEKDQKAIDGYEQYAMKGYNLPIALKFHLLKDKLENASKGFILENFPATKEDLDTLTDFLDRKSLKIDKVFYMNVSQEEMKKRMVGRARIDDTEEIVAKRRVIQSEERQPVVDYFKSSGVLIEIDGEGSVEEVQARVLQHIEK